MKIFLSMLVSFVAINVFAHGTAVPDDVRPGPNGGFVKRANSFSIEVVPVKDGTLNIFLLDLSLKNPTVRDSSLNITLEQGKNKDFFSCSEVGTHFNCVGIDKLSFDKGSLTIEANRSGATGRAKYDLPFALTKQSPSGDKHNH